MDDDPPPRHSSLPPQDTGDNDRAVEEAASIEWLRRSRTRAREDGAQGEGHTEAVGEESGSVVPPWREGADRYAAIQAKARRQADLHARKRRNILQNKLLEQLKSDKEACLRWLRSKHENLVDNLLRTELRAEEVAVREDDAEFRALRAALEMQQKEEDMELERFIADEYSRLESRLRSHTQKNQRSRRERKMLLDAASKTRERQVQASAQRVRDKLRRRVVGDLV